MAVVTEALLGRAKKLHEERSIGSHTREVASSLSTTVCILTDLDPAASLQVQDILFEQAVRVCASNIPPAFDMACMTKIVQCH